MHIHKWFSLVDVFQASSEWNIAVHVPKQWCHVLAPWYPNIIISSLGMISFLSRHSKTSVKNNWIANIGCICNVHETVTCTYYAVSNCILGRLTSGVLIIDNPFQCCAVKHQEAQDSWIFSVHWIGMLSITGRCVCITLFMVCSIFVSYDSNILWPWW